MGDEITGTRIDVRAARGRIVVSGATAGMRQAVYSLSGQLIYDGSAATVSVPAGTYVVRVGGQTFIQSDGNPLILSQTIYDDENNYPTWHDLYCGDVAGRCHRRTRL